MTPGFTEEWFPEQSQARLAELAESVADVPGAIIEIGSWEGRSTIALANAVHPRTVNAVDTWLGSPGEVSSQLAAERDVFAQFKANVYEWTAGNVLAHRMGWRDFVNGGRFSPVAFVFIDAEHTYDEVRDTIAAFVPLMSPGGVICGDDAHHPPVRQAALEAFPDAQHVATLWSAVMPA
jgi:predicted O-methyltransferase YrrM